MYKKLSLLLLAAIISFSSCKKGAQKSACGTQVCTAIFATIGVNYKDKNNNPTSVNNFTVINQRTNKQIYATLTPGANFVPGYFIIADDGNRNEFSTDGDDIKVTATNPATGQTKITLYKISGGSCNCHIDKVSGPEQVTFDQ
ncbi:MAG TPA: hypothetical protein VK668_18750 [Mucilaginibacter sp.]|nr:hypothetical protein [Mucilaginibacter sp.]